MSRTIGDRLRGVGPAAGAKLLQSLERINPAAKDRAARAVAGWHVKAYRRMGGRYVSRYGAPTLLLTTTGRRTAQPRTTALFYTPHGDRQVLVASYAGDHRHPQWYLNLAADPEVRVQIGNDVWAATAEVATGPEREALWSRVVETWPGYRSYQARAPRELPLVVLTPAT